MELQVTEIKVVVDSVSWVKHGCNDGEPIKVGDTIVTERDENGVEYVPIYVDDYDVTNPGESAIITVQTDGIVKDIELRRCTPECGCGMFSITQERTENIPKGGGTFVIASYSIKGDMEDKCDTSTFTCKTTSSFVTVSHDVSNRKFSATFSPSEGLERTARFTFSYNNNACSTFSLTQEPKETPTECNEHYKVTASAKEVMCDGGILSFSVEGVDPPVQCDYYDIQEEIVTPITSDGGKIKFTIDGGGGDTDFDNLLSQFNTTLSSLSLRQVNENTTPKTHAYLSLLYNEAVSTFNDSNSELFKKSTYQEIHDYRTGSTTNHERGLSAMTAWLMAMQLSEIVANSGSSNNNQTELFKKAYNIGGGRKAPLYGYSDLRSDVTICRLAASAIYGKNKNHYGFVKIDEMRSEMGTTPNDRSTTWDKYGYSINGDSHKCDNSVVVNLGYDIDFNAIFPAAAGPYATKFNVEGRSCTPSNPTAANRQPDSEQPSNQFNSTTKNYLVDEQIDNIATENYNLYTVTQYLPRAVQAVADDSDSVIHFFANTVYYKYNSDRPLGSFSAGTPNANDNNGSFSGTFSTDVIGKDLSALLIDSQGNPTALRTFFSGVKDMGGSSRKSLLDKQYGRRRPGQGTDDDTPRCVCGNGIDGGCTNCSGTECTRLNWMDDSTIARLVGTGTRYDDQANPRRYYIDSNGNGKWDNGEPYYGDAITGTINLCPATAVKAATYPSGHSAGSWTIGMFLMQMIPNNWLKIYKAMYGFAVSRTIVRAHWNSDTLYGKLCASAFVPVINSFKNSSDGNFREKYNAAKAIIDAA